MSIRLAVVSLPLILALGACRREKVPGPGETLECFEVLRVPFYPDVPLHGGEGYATAVFRLEGARTVATVQAAPVRLKSAVQTVASQSRLRRVCPGPVTVVYHFRIPGGVLPHSKWEFRYPNILTVIEANGGPPDFVDYMDMTPQVKK